MLVWVQFSTKSTYKMTQCWALSNIQHMNYTLQVKVSFCLSFLYFTLVLSHFFFIEKRCPIQFHTGAPKNTTSVWTPLLMNKVNSATANATSKLRKNNRRKKDFATKGHSGLQKLKMHFI